MKAEPVTVKLKVEPEIDLSGLSDEILDALADKITERLRTRTIVITNPAYPQPQWPLGQVWC